MNRRLLIGFSMIVVIGISIVVLWYLPTNYLGTRVFVPPDAINPDFVDSVPGEAVEDAPAEVAVSPANTVDISNDIQGFCQATQPNNVTRCVTAEQCGRAVQDCEAQCFKDTNTDQACFSQCSEMYQSCFQNVPL